MDVDNIDLDLYRIIAGYYFINYNNKSLKVKSPSLKIKYEAEQLYEFILEDNRYTTSWIDDLYLQVLLDTQNIWKKADEDFLKHSQGLLDSNKKMLYKEFKNKESRKSIKKDLEIIRIQISDLHKRKDSLNHMTLKDFAGTIKNEFIIMNCVYVKNKPFFKKENLNNYDYKIVQDLSKFFIDNQLTVSRLRKISRSDTWRSYYSDNTFNKGSAYQTDDQRHLISLSKMYDSVRQHMEAPTEEVIEDDDALDGWFLVQKEKSEKEKNKNHLLEKIGNKTGLGNDGEVFIMSSDKEETGEIYGLNNPLVMRDLKKNLEIAKEKGSVSWTDLESVIDEKLKEQGKLGYQRIK